jgi:hypothetical protein
MFYQLMAITDTKNRQELFNFERRNNKFRDKMNCKLWNKCKVKECLFEAIEYGSCLWSVDICYALEDLKKKGLIQEVKQ